MKYVTSFERSGIEIGKQQEALSIVTRLLNRRLGTIFVIRNYWRNTRA